MYVFPVEGHILNMIVIDFIVRFTKQYVYYFYEYYLNSLYSIQIIKTGAALVINELLLVFCMFK